MIDGATMLTSTGRYVQPLYPNDWTPDIEEIAHALSNLCRFTGHVREFYSVAEHSCRVAEQLPDELQLAGLLHDAAEAYLGDMATPLKTHPFFGSAYRSAERALEQRIGEAFGVDLDHDLIHSADKRLLATERRDLMPATDEAWLILQHVRPLKDVIVPWTPIWAKHEFLLRYETLILATAA